MSARIDQLTAPAEVGRDYLVPTVFGKWWVFAPRHWPVIGPQHNDRQCLDFDPQHYHLDARFVFVNACYEFDRDFWQSVFTKPLMTGPRINPDGLPEPVWRRRMCRRPINPWTTPNALRVISSPRWRCHFDMWTGKQARRDERGWVCPHRSVPLADQPVVDGVVTCPLHLLRIDATTGAVLPPLEVAP